VEPDGFVYGGEIELQCIILSNYRVPSGNYRMERIVCGCAVKVAGHVSVGDVVEGPEVPASLDAADPVWDAGCISVAVEGSIVPDVPWVAENVRFGGMEDGEEKCYPW